MQESPVKIDTLLEPLLTATSEEQADELLSQLIAGHAEPVIKGSFVSNSASTRIRKRSVRNLMTFIRTWCCSSSRSCSAFQTSQCESDHRRAWHGRNHRASTCARWMRRQFPERHALKNRLHYLLTRQRGFAIWEDNNGKPLAGFTTWQQQKMPAARNVFDVENLPAHIRTLKSDKAPELAEAVASILNYAGGPVEFDELVSAVAAIQGISDQPVESLAEDEEGGFDPATADPDPAWRIEKKMFLQRLWEELTQLPVNQRAALLLN